MLKNGDENINVKIYKVQFEKANHNKAIGILIVEKSSIKIMVSDGYIVLKEFKFPGKKQMEVKSFLNGFSFQTNPKMI